VGNLVTCVCFQTNGSDVFSLLGLRMLSSHTFSSGFPNSRTSNSRYELLRDFQLLFCCVRLNSLANPDRSNGCRVLRSISNGSDRFFSCALLPCCLLDVMTFQRSRFICSLNGRLLCLLFGLYHVHENADPPEIIFIFESSKDSSTPASLQSIHMHTKVLSTLSFPVALTSKENLSSSPFSLRWRIQMPSWLSVYSSNLLLSISRYSVTLRRSLGGFFFKITELKEFSSPCAYLHTYSMPSWQSIFSQNVQQFCPLSVHSMHPLNALLAELSESLVILFLQ
jgi:hypothetical protein